MVHRACCSEWLSQENISPIKELKTNLKKENLNKSNNQAVQNESVMCLLGGAQPAPHVSPLGETRELEDAATWGGPSEHSPVPPRASPSQPT